MKTGNLLEVYKNTIILSLLNHEWFLVVTFGLVIYRKFEVNLIRGLPREVIDFEVIIKYLDKIS